MPCVGPGHRACRGRRILRNQYAALRPLLADNAFRGPLYLESAETPQILKGDVHAVVEHPFADVSAAFARPGEPPDYIGGLRGLVERNTMRYYLAIDACLDAIAVPPADQLEKRLRDWFDATEKYPRQLHETGRDAYLAMKRREYQRRQSAQ